MTGLLDPKSSEKIKIINNRPFLAMALVVYTSVMGFFYPVAVLFLS